MNEHLRNKLVEEAFTQLKRDNFKLNQIIQKIEKEKSKV
jgi:hypothetical protein